MLSPERRRSVKEQSNKSKKLVKNVIFHPAESVMKYAEVVSDKTVDQYFNILSKLRTTHPTKIRLLKWEKKAIKDLEAGDSDDKETWLKLKDQGWTHKRLYSKYLLDQHVLPVRLFDKFAEQSTHAKNGKSWLDEKNNLLDHMDTFVQRRALEIATVGVVRSSLVAMPQNPDAAFPIATVGLSSGYVSSQVNTDGNVGNTLGRIDDELRILLRTHYKSHEGAIKNSLRESEIPSVNARLFNGARLTLEGNVAKARVKAMGVGVGMAHLAHILSGSSWTERGINLGEATIAAVGGGLLYRKVRQERGKENAYEYDQEQTAFHKEADKWNRSISSQVSANGMAIDLFGETQLPQRREHIVKMLHESHTKANGVLDAFPWLLTMGSTGLAYISPAAGDLVISLLVTGGVIKGDMSKLTQEFSWQRNNEQRKLAVNTLASFIKEIEESPYHVPTYLEIDRVREKRDLPLLTAPEAKKKMYGKPLIIEALDIGNMERKVKVERPILLTPGSVSVVKAEKGTGKSNLAKMITLLLGNVEGIKVTRGDVDLVQLDSETRNKEMRFIDASSFSSEHTMADQLSELLRKPDDNLFKKELIDVLHDDRKSGEVYRYINSHQGSEPSEQQRYTSLFSMKPKIGEILEILLSNDHPKKEGFLNCWAQNPTNDQSELFKFSQEWLESFDTFFGKADPSIANALLNVAFSHYIRRIDRHIRTTEQAADYVLKKPGAQQGTSAGQGAAFGVLLALSENADFICLDEPSAHLGDDYVIIASLLRDYLQRNPQSIILMNEHHEELTNTLKGFSRSHNTQFVDKLITSSPKSTSDLLIWEAKAILPRLG